MKGDDKFIVHYEQKIIAMRIKAERNAADLSMENLAERINVTRNTIAAWERQEEEKGGRIPPLSDLLKMCDVFECELGYLLGEYDCKTRAATDIHAETGLNEEAIKLLKGVSQLCPSPILRTVNMVLTHNDFSVLDAIHNYLNYMIPTARVTIWSDGSSGESSDEDKSTAKMGQSFPREAIEDTLLISVQHRLKQLKEWMRSNKVLNNEYEQFKEHYGLNELSADDMKKTVRELADEQERRANDGKH